MPSGISLSVTGLTAATTYYYRVRAYNAGGTSTNSGSKIVLSAGTGVSTIDAASLTIAVKIGSVEISTNGTIELIKVTNINGIPFVETKVNDTKASINTNNWNSGVYIFIINSGSETIVKKISIIK